LIGHSFTQVLCYVIGLLALVTVARNPDDIYAAFIALPARTIGFAILAAREMDQSFANVYSTGISTQNLRPLWDRRVLAVIITAIARRRGDGPAPSQPEAAGGRPRRRIGVKCELPVKPRNPKFAQCSNDWPTS
jgi:hypothetical protein